MINPSSQFQLTLGVNPGYFHNNEEPDPVGAVVKEWQQAAGEEHKVNGIYVAANVIPSVTVYAKEWGCPDAGEQTVQITGVCNTEFVKPAEWREAVIRVSLAVANSLQQKTAYLTFNSVDFMYIQL